MDMVYGLLNLTPSPYSGDSAMKESSLQTRTTVGVFA